MHTRDSLRWNGSDLCFGSRVMASIEPDAKYAGMWRVRLPCGQLSDLLNRTRARDAARAMALAQLNSRRAA